MCRSGKRIRLCGLEFFCREDWETGRGREDFVKRKNKISQLKSISPSTIHGEGARGWGSTQALAYRPIFFPQILADVRRFNASVFWKDVFDLIKFYSRPRRGARRQEDGETRRILIRSFLIINSIKKAVRTRQPFLEPILSFHIVLKKNRIEELMRFKRL